MKKIDIGANAFVYPMPVTLLGTLVNAKPNFMALGWITRVNANPPMVGVGVGRHHYTCPGIAETKAFSINYPSAEMMQVTDYCGMATGEKVDKSSLFEVFYGKLKTAPMIAECTLCMECRLVQTIEFPTNTLFIGEIVGSYAEEICLADGKPDIKKMDPLLLTMPDNRYWRVGEYAGKAWGSGKGFKKEG
jgi:flavin reductase (DIM6/NTAB) family NADH-FMN oxidoreductase RutF